MKYLRVLQALVIVLAIIIVVLFCVLLFYHPAQSLVSTK